MKFLNARITVHNTHKLAYIDDKKVNKFYRKV